LAFTVNGTGIAGNAKIWSRKLHSQNNKLNYNVLELDHLNISLMLY